MKKLVLLAFVSILIVSCQNEEDDFINDLSTDNIDQSKLIDFMGLKVNHRFSQPIESKSGNNFNRSNSVLDSTTVITIVESLLPQFPYRLEGDFSQSDLDMIKNDFPLMSNQEIADSQEIIELYYEINFQNECEVQYNLSNGGGGPGNPNFARTSYSELLCAYNQAGYGFSNFRGLFAYYKASNSAINTSTTEFPNLSAGDTKRDAYRHILWNTLLSQHYLSLFSKAKRTAFAKSITDAHELCPDSNGDFNTADATAMDFHNNQIGRDIWDNNTGYKTFLGITLGLRYASVSDLKAQVAIYVNTARFVNTKTLGITATVNEINNSVPQNKAVFIKNDVDFVNFEQSTANKISIASLDYDLLINNNQAPVTFYVESPNILGMQIGDRLDISYAYNCLIDFDEGPGSGGPLQTGSDFQVNFNGQGTITQSLGNNKFLLVPDNAGWIVNGTPNPSPTGCTFSTLNYSAVFNF